MHATTISFCNGVALNIRSDDSKREIMHELSSRWGVDPLRSPPPPPDVTEGAIPCVASIRTAGNPYLLFLRRHPEYGEQCVFIDKKVQVGYSTPRMIVVRLGFSRALYESGGTLFDGEMVRLSRIPDHDDDGGGGSARDIGRRHHPRWQFVINDILAYRGCAPRVCIITRVDAIHQTLERAYNSDPDNDPCVMRVRRLFDPVDDASALIEFATALPYPCRGVVFEPRMAGALAHILMPFRANECDDSSPPLKEEDDDTSARTRAIGGSGEQRANGEDAFDLPHFIRHAATQHVAATCERIPDHRRAMHTMYLRWTRMIDVYELWWGVVGPSSPSTAPPPPVFAGFLSLYDLPTSRVLQVATSNMKCTDALCIKCIWDECRREWHVARLPEPTERLIPFHATPPHQHS